MFHLDHTAVGTGHITPVDDHTVNGAAVGCRILPRQPGIHLVRQNQQVGLHGQGVTVLPCFHPVVGGVVEIRNPLGCGVPAKAQRLFPDAVGRQKHSAPLDMFPQLYRVGVAGMQQSVPDGQGGGIPGGVIVGESRGHVIVGRLVPHTVGAFQVTGKGGGGHQQHHAQGQGKQRCPVPVNAAAGIFAGQHSFRAKHQTEQAAAPQCPGIQADLLGAADGVDGGGPACPLGGNPGGGQQHRRAEGPAENQPERLYFQRKVQRHIAEQALRHHIEGGLQRQEGNSQSSAGQNQPCGNADQAGGQGLVENNAGFLGRGGAGTGQQSQRPAAFRQAQGKGVGHHQRCAHPDEDQQENAQSADQAHQLVAAAVRHGNAGPGQQRIIVAAVKDVILRCEAAVQLLHRVKEVAVRLCLPAPEGDGFPSCRVLLRCFQKDQHHIGRIA